MKHLNLSFLLLLSCYFLTAQPPATTAGGYFYATGTNYSLANMTGAEEVIGSEMEFVSTITFDMGFTFNFAGTGYNQFSVSSSGTLGLGTIPVSPIYYEPNNSILAPYYKFPMLIPWSDELTTAANGGVSYKIFTVNNLKKLVIEWRLRASSDDETSDYNKTFQAWLWEGSNKIQYVYGNSPVRDENSYIGIAKSNPDYKLVNSGTHNIGMYSNYAWPGAGRSYIFSPVEIIAGPLPISLEEGGSTGNVNCFGASNGSVTLGTITGGDGNYTITWSGPNGYTGTGSTINNIGGGIYNFTITDGAGSEPVTGSRTISEPAMLDATLTNSQACAGNYNGNISITNAVGGSGNYEYRINNTNPQDPAGWQSSGSFNSLGAGTYTLQMRDSTTTSCVKTLSTQTVTEFALTATLTATEACAGTNNGTISISNPTGGSGNYEYSINNGIWQTSNLFNVLNAGSYHIQMRDIDFNSCIKILGDQIINEYSLNASVSSASACAGASNGSISISNATGGSNNYEYSINNGNWQNSNLFSELTAGAYSVQMRDTAFTSCIKDLGTQTITEYSLNATLSSTAACAGTSNGSISISNATGGTGNYEFSINNGTWQSSNLFNGLAAGIYSVQMRNAANTGCVKLLANQVIPAFSLNAVVSSLAACPGINSGSISISNATGGSGNYAYQLNNSNWQAAAAFTGLNAGSYALYMRDANNTTCVANLGIFTVAQATAPVVSISANAPAFCNSLMLTASTTNGASYVWSNGATGISTSLHVNNADGPYTVTVTNSNGCSASATYQYAKQHILNSYTIVGLKTITLGEGNTVNGSVGLTAAGQTTKIGKNSVINGFVKSPVISLSQPVIITNGSFASVAVLTLPAMLLNTAVTTGLPNLTLPDDYNGPAINYNVNSLTIGKRAQVTLTGNVFGKITVKEAADVFFTATDISINEIATNVGKSSPSGIDYLSLNFNANTVIRIKNTITLGEKNMVNGAGATFYMGDVNTDAEKISINGKNTIINANTYMPRGTMVITQAPGADATTACVMNGTHIDETITSGKYVNWSAIDCNAEPAGFQTTQPKISDPAKEIFTMAIQAPSMPQQVLVIEKVSTTKQGISVYPNPTTGKFMVQLFEDGIRVDIKIINPAGQQIIHESFVKPVKGQELNFNISNYPAGLYHIKVITDSGVYTKQFLKIN